MSFKIVSAEKTVAAAATPEALAASGATPHLQIQCPAANTSDILIGDSSGQLWRVAKGTSIDLGSVDNERGVEVINLADVYVKAGTNGDKAVFMYVVIQ